ncbi:hypothetical protein EVB32_024 [Rhizobium phage RHph_TM39]|uniref:Uncharacterized protein n=2 Tax=Cuauhnahuacvirus TaxID=3044696 RepID=A0A7S5R7K9_9CAUD|nr:hypothetical protein PQC16_gp024 [Rhizobium phage RHph_TM30]YP_010671173.1 hypothetical protein PQC17_gp024 [Rhizobium phage RHph_Y65]QIG71495.1 hypothetical protein EVB94_024 [Rhizobium phage RHph_TM40]QIG71858.1 hypothetical protein EVB95_024 [Rhizobium phage RHph_TM2_3B]QIG72220.1 hypothetical protein EVB96_024 [Rhizobium phage RHph_TM3_3_6]QIG77012.1 hypothetical protein EVB32_024 [Rhizobium phage RHph_TM39]QIG77611.1 hypothetical protein EVB64_024 [Rhizobium phage RHph_TM61]
MMQAKLPYDLVIDNDTMWFAGDDVKFECHVWSDGSMSIMIHRGTESVLLHFDNISEAEKSGWNV